MIFCKTLFTGSADMRKGFDGPGGLVIHKLNQDPLSGAFLIYRDYVSYCA